MTLAEVAGWMAYNYDLWARPLVGALAGLIIGCGHVMAAVYGEK